MFIMVKAEEGEKGIPLQKRSISIEVAGFVYR